MKKQDRLIKKVKARLSKTQDLVRKGHFSNNKLNQYTVQEDRLSQLLWEKQKPKPKCKKYSTGAAIMRSNIKQLLEAE